MRVRILPPDELLEADVRLPESKSVAARAMLIGAVAGRRPSAEGPADECDDLRVLRRALAGEPRGEKQLEMSGTALRFLTAYYAALEGSDVVLTGAPRLLERPVGPLVDALRAMGADIEWLGQEGCAPLHIRGRRLTGGPVALDCSLSSQPASALLLASPLMERPVEIEAAGGEIASAPYLELTRRMLQRAGGEPRPEGDWSAAAFWYELAALSSGFVTLRGLDTASAQPDAACARLFADFGIVTVPAEEGPGLDLQVSPDYVPRLNRCLADNPDLVQPLAVTAALLRLPFRFTGLATLRHKECDRIEALCTELARCGFVLDAGADELAWEGATVPVAEMPAFDAHGDHRMAMALAPVALVVPGITVDGAECVAKSWPGYWDSLRAAGFTVEEVAAE